MATILLLHSVRGLRDLERASADRLRSAGHEVVVPDLFEGETPATLEEGVALEERLWPEPARRAERAAEALPDDAVLAGFSMGAAISTILWDDRPAAGGLLLFHGLGELPEAPRPGAPVQVHVAEPDPFAPEDDIAAWREAAAKAGVAVELFRYPGAGHLFTDPTMDDYDEKAAGAVWERALAFLDRV